LLLLRRRERSSLRRSGTGSERRRDVFERELIGKLESRVRDFLADELHRYGESISVEVAGSCDVG
jgi:hypothetical protein